MAKRNSAGQFVTGHSLNYTYPEGYNKKSWFKEGHIGIKNNGRIGMGPTKTSFKSGNVPWNKNISMVHSGSFKSGKMHLNWLGGIGKLPYPFKFNRALKLKIKARDKFTCRNCNTKEVDLKNKLCIHHIDYNKKNLSDGNLISLCRRCHGKTNANRDEWRTYLSGVLK